MAKKHPDTKRLPSNSAEAQKKAMANALAKPLEPPAHVRLQPHEMPFWESVVCARARENWDTADLEVAANLARCKSDIEIQNRYLRIEGAIVKNDRGTQIGNPRFAVIETLTRRSIALSRFLQVNAAAKNGDARDSAAALEAERLARKAVQGAKDEAPAMHEGGSDLIPTPATMQ